MPEEPARAKRLAMLIDGDNAQPSLLAEMLAETTKYGNVIIRRVYGDWASSNMSQWKRQVLHGHGVQPIHQTSYTSGKNATDIGMIIDAMDLLHAGDVDGFCIISSDSDFTPLAIRIREQGMFVMGIGRSNTPQAFQHACERFVHTENLGVPSGTPLLMMIPAKAIHLTSRWLMNLLPTNHVLTGSLASGELPTPRIRGTIGLLR